MPWTIVVKTKRGRIAHVWVDEKGKLGAYKTIHSQKKFISCTYKLLQTTAMVSSTFYALTACVVLLAQHACAAPSPRPSPGPSPSPNPQNCGCPCGASIALIGTSGSCGYGCNGGSYLGSSYLGSCGGYGCGYGGYGGGYGCGYGCGSGCGSGCGCSCGCPIPVYYC
uniref:Uncharacterized protein n=1 Tax=Lygus hesperus TaxID=30085 RepID=A0A146LY48_LYGHE